MPSTAPATPTTTRTRDRDDGGSGTPVRAQPVRRTATYKLPSDFDLGAVNISATPQRTVRANFNYFLMIKTQ